MNSYIDTLLSESFSDSKKAIESSFHSKELSFFDIYKLIFRFLFIGLILRLIVNLVFFGISFQNPETVKLSTIWESLPLFIGIYGFVFILVRGIDIFRLYFRFEKSNYSWEGAPKHILLICFIPFFSTAMFWILPDKLSILLMGFAFIHCSYQAYLQLLYFHNWSNSQLFRMMMYFAIMIMVYGFMIVTILKLTTGF